MYINHRETMSVSAISALESEPKKLTFVSRHSPAYDAFMYTKYILKYSFRTKSLFTKTISFLIVFDEII